MFLTDFADQGVVVPVAVAVAAAAVLLRRTRLALAWLLALGGVFATMLLLKLAGAVEQPETAGTWAQIKE